MTERTAVVTTMRAAREVGARRCGSAWHGALAAAGRRAALLGAVAAAGCGAVGFAPPPLHLVLQAPARTVAGQPLALALAVRDGRENVATYARGTLRISASDASAGLPPDRALTAGDGGQIAALGGTVLRRAGAVTVGARALEHGELTASAQVQVLPARATHFVVMSSSDAVGLGSGPELTITACDAYGNVATGYSGDVHLAASDPSAVLPPDAHFTAADAGRVTLAAGGLQLNGAGPAEIMATDVGNPQVAGSVAVLVLAAPAPTPVPAPALVLVTPSSTTVVSGTPSTFQVTLLDAYERVLTQFRGPVQISCSDEFATCPTSVTFTAADAGSLAVSGIVLVTAGPAVVTATEPASMVAGTGGITVLPGSATHIVASSRPVSSTAGSDYVVTLTALDAADNIATDYAGTVTFTGSDPQVVPPASFTFSASDAGQHAVSVVLVTAGDQTVTGATGLGSVDLGTTVTPAAAAGLRFTGLPANTTAGTPLTATVAAVDAYGNVATDFTGAVQFTSNDGQANLPPTTTYASADQGVRTVSVTLTTAGSRSVSASAASGTLLGSAAVSVSPAATASFTIAGMGGTLYPTDAAQALTLTAVDAYNNTTPSYTGTVAFSSTDPNTVLPANQAFTAGNNGVVTVATPIKLRNTGAQTVTVTDTGAPGVHGTSAATTLVWPTVAIGSLTAQYYPYTLLGYEGQSTFIAAGRTWLFQPAANGSTGFRFTSTADSGKTWTATTDSGRAIGCGYGNVSVWADGSRVYYAGASGASTLVYGRGTLQAAGTISWDAAEQSVPGITTNEQNKPHVAGDTSRRGWVAVDPYPTSTSGSSQTISVTATSATDGTWSTASGFPYTRSTETSNTVAEAVPVPMANGQVMVVRSDYQDNSPVNSVIADLFTIGGNLVGSTTLCAASGNPGNAWWVARQTAVGSDVHVSYGCSNAAQYSVYSASSAAWSTAAPPAGVLPKVGAAGNMLTADPATGDVWAIWPVYTTSPTRVSIWVAIRRASSVWTVPQLCIASTTLGSVNDISSSDRLTAGGRVAIHTVGSSNNSGNYVECP